MKPSHTWNPSALQLSPMFAPLQPLISSFEMGKFPTLMDINLLLESCHPPIGVQGGYPLRFVPQEPGRLGFEAQYEPRCYLTGEVQTRPDNWHDFFNAMVWLTFPKAKAAINFRHYQALIQKTDPLESQRGSVRDMATLLDESGVIVVCADAGLAEQLCTFQWKELFWHNRDKLQAAMSFYIFGHGLYEKALQPYLGMTGQGLILHVPAEFFNIALPEQLSYLDARVAEYLDNPAHCLSPRELHPVPLLGIPGWSHENEVSAFYDNRSYFREGRRASK